MKLGNTITKPEQQQAEPEPPIPKQRGRPPSQPPAPAQVEGTEQETEQASPEREFTRQVVEDFLARFQGTFTYLPEGVRADLMLAQYAASLQILAALERILAALERIEKQ